MPRELITVDDLAYPDIDALLARAAAIQAGEFVARDSFSVGLVMLQPSLRSRIGFAEAARRLGGQAHAVDSVRDAPGTSAPESVDDLLRVMAGMTDLLVVRAALNLGSFRDRLPVPLINAGDAVEHPTQALIDLFAIERFCGPIGTVRVAICGDLAMRACRSLMKLLSRRPPARLRLIAPSTRQGDAARLVSPIAEHVEFREPGSFDDIDALYLSGLPAKRGGDVITSAMREAYALTDSSLHRLAPNAAIFSPMPVIDEISTDARTDTRLKMFAQSDGGVPVRMAVMEMLLRLKHND